MAKKVLSMLLSLAIVFTMLMSVTVCAISGDITGGEERMDPLGHILDYRNEVAATCTSPGYKIYYCEECAKEYNYDYTELADHTESDWITDVEATAESVGHKHTECTVCHTHIKEEDIPKLTVTHIPGDVNDDGTLNNKDLTRLFQYLSDWDVEVNEAALDINGDGSVNNKDLTRLFQYLSDWDVEIF